MKATKYLASLALTILLVGCQAVHSDELKTTKAGDLEIDAIVWEYKTSDQVNVGAQMQTMASQIGVEFTQGEILTAASDTENGISGEAYLSNAGFLNLNKSYEGVVGKTIAGGNYYITYTDMDDVVTTATFATGTVSDVISPSEGAAVSGDTVEITWSPEEMSGSVGISITWSGGGSSGYSFRNVNNSGSFLFDISHMSGSGTISLVNTTKYTSMPGFGQANITMNNVSRRDIAFTATVDPANKTVGGNLLADLKPEEIVEDMLHRCLKHCAEGEEIYFYVDEIEYSCCLE